MQRKSTGQMHLQELCRATLPKCFVKTLWKATRNPCFYPWVGVATGNDAVAAMWNKHFEVLLIS